MEYSILKEAFRLCHKVVDPVSEPYKSKYKASEILKSLSRTTKNETIRHLALGRKGLICMSTEEPTKAREYLNKALMYFCPISQSKGAKILEDNIEDKILPFASDVMSFYNALATLQFSIENHLWHHDLEVSLSIYSKIKENAEKYDAIQKHPFSISSLSDSWDDSLEGMTALSLFYLAQMISERGNCGDKELSCVFLTRTLGMRHQQLLKDIDFAKALDWSNCVRGMAEYHRSMNNRVQALSLIEAAQEMLRKCNSILPIDNRELEKFEGVRCELSRLRALLYIDSMRIAVRDNNNNEEEEEEDMETSILDTKIIPKAFPGCSEITSTSTIGLLNPVYIRNNLPEAMRAAFQIVRSNLEFSLKHFVLDGYVSQHVEISRELCKAYDYVAQAEPCENLTMKIKIHRRMINILRPIFDVLNRDIFGETLISLTFELAEICVSLQMIKETQLKQKDDINVNSITRIRKYAFDAVKYFDTFCEMVEKEGRGNVHEARVVSYVLARGDNIYLAGIDFFFLPLSMLFDITMLTHSHARSILSFSGTSGQNFTVPG